MEALDDISPNLAMDKDTDGCTARRLPPPSNSNIINVFN